MYTDLRVVQMMCFFIFSSTIVYSILESFRLPPSSPLNTKLYFEINIVCKF